MSISEPSWGSAQSHFKAQFGALTRSINPKAIAPECKDLAASFVHHGLREVLRLTDMFDKFQSDLLYKLKCRLPGFKCSAPGLVVEDCPPYLRSVSSEPSKLFCLFSSAISASLAASSASVGKFSDTGGVTPYFLD